MLQASLSSVIMAVITTNIFLILLTLCLSNRRLLLGIGYRLLALFVFFTVFRLALPFELPFTINIPLPTVLSLVVSLCHIELGTVGRYALSPWIFFVVIWIAGTILGLLRYIISYCRSSYLITLYGKELTRKAPYAELLERICRERNRRNRFRVIELPGLDGPLLFGVLSPRILIPEHFELSERDLYYILRHETSHHFHRDLLLKGLVKIITLVYWWDPFCRKLNAQTEIILEMRVDDTLTLTDIQLTEEYMQSLIAAKSFAAQSVLLPDEFTMKLLPEESSDALKRFSLLRYNQRTPQLTLNILLILCTFSIFLFSYIFIGEPYSRPEDSLFAPTETQETFHFLSDTESYFIDNGDGSYDLYYYGKYILTTDSLEYYGTDTPVYPEEYRPQ